MYYRTWTEKIMYGVLENLKYKVGFYALLIKKRDIYEHLISAVNLSQSLIPG